MTAATEIELQRLSLFATPLAVQVMPEAASLNGALLPALTPFIASAPEGPGDAWRQAIEPEGAAAAALESLVARALALVEAMSDESSRVQPGNTTLEVLRAGQAVAVGSQPAAAWYARYVLDDGGCAGRRDYGARFEAQDPRGVGPVMYAPHLTIADPAGPTLGISQTIGLKTGAILVHPGWLLHGIETYSGPQAFVSLVIEFGR